MIQFYPSYFIRKYVAQVCAYIHCHEVATRIEVEEIALAICLESLLAASETKLSANPCQAAQGSCHPLISEC